MNVVAIYLNTGKGAPMRPSDRVMARAGRGIEGNRYFGTDERPVDADREITLIEAEAIESLPRDASIPFDPSESRRNVVTRGVALNDLVGRTFRVGEATLLGVRPCHPCEHLESLTRPGVLRALTGRGGLRAQILADGAIRVGDSIESVASSQ
jgi:MOSC domain-containing protein YiiM